jgi:DNA-binding XRE family transcriptional regulator
MEARMPRTLKEVVASLPKEEQQQIADRARELIAEEMSLQQLRKALGKTQIAVAKKLRVGQHAVSKLETRSDMYLSTLRGYVEAMGGELEIVAKFPDLRPIRLEEVGVAAPQPKKRDPRRQGVKGAPRRELAHA